MKIKAHIECNSEGFYSIYIEESLPFGFFGEGYTEKEAKQDFLNVFNAMKEDYVNETGQNLDVEFEFVYDATAILHKYKGIFTLAGLSKLTGIHKAQLSQYVCGKRNPSKRTTEKIKQSVSKFADELKSVTL